MDLDELAKKAGFKNGHVASTQWSNIKKKYNIGNSGDGASPRTPGGKTAKGAAGSKPSQRKRNAEESPGSEAYPMAKKLFTSDEWLWADSAYALDSWCITPYKKPLSNLAENKTFNYHLSRVSAPMVLSCTF